MAIDLDELRLAIRQMTRKQSLYKLLKEELMARDHWKLQDRGRIKHKAFYPSNWREIVVAVKQERGNVCENCGQVGDRGSDGRVNVLAVHHIRYRDVMSTDDLVLLCTRCHLKKHADRTFTALNAPSARAKGW